MSLVNIRRRLTKTTGLAGYLALLVFSGFMLAERAAAESTFPSTIHFRSPRGFSIVAPVYVNGSGPFEFLLDTGSAITIVDPELLQSLKLDVIESGMVTTPTGKAKMSLAIARTVSVGSVTQKQVELGVRDLSGLRKLDPKIRGVLGQNVLKDADYLIDNRKRTIEFDAAGALLSALGGERVITSRVETPDNPNYGGSAVRIRLGGPDADDCEFLLDTGSASVVLFSDSPDVARMPKQSIDQVLEDDGGRQKHVSAYPMQLRVGSTHRDVEVYIATLSSRGLGVEGLLPTAGFGSVYISNTGGFVILQPKRNRRATAGE